MAHEIPASAVIYCKPCHFSKCYTHLLELDCIHSVDAIILSERHDGDVHWHQSHRNSSQQYQEARQRVIEDEEKSSRPNVSHKLTYLAKTFSTCRTMAPEVTKYGWYDRFAQTTTIPVSHFLNTLFCRLHHAQIANSPAKALVGLPDEIDGDEPHDIHTSDGSPSSSLVKPAETGSQMAGSCRTSTSPFVISSTSPGGINELPPLRQSSLPVIPDSRIVDPMSSSPKPGMTQVLGSSTGAGTRTQHDISKHGFPSAPCSPSSARPPPIVASLSSADFDDPGNLSDLTDLLTEVGSPPRNLNAPIPTSETSNQHLSMELSLSPSPTPVASSSTQFVPRSKSRSRLVFDCVEIPQPEWHNRRGERIPSSSRRKRKRITGPSSSDISGPPDSDFDNLLLVAKEIISTQSLSTKRKRKMSQGPASR